MKKCKSFLFLIIIIVSLSTVSACAKGDSESSDGEVTISILTRWPQFTELLNDKLIPEFEKENPNIKIKQPEIATHGNYIKFLQSAVNGDDLPDIFANHSALPTHQLYKLGVLHKLDDVVGDRKDEFEKGVWTTGATTMDDNIYALPLFSNKRGSIFMYYNKSVLEEAGLTEEDIPKTWDELIDVSKKIKQETDAYGTYMEMNYWTIRNVVSEMATAISPEEVFTLQNKSINYQTGEFNYNTEGYKESMEFLKKLVDEDLNEPSDKTRTKAEGPGVLAAGKTAFLFSGSFATLDMEREDFDDYGVAPLPTKNGEEPYATYSGASLAGGLHVSKDTEHYDEVKKFLEFIIDKGYPAMIEDEAGQPPIPSVIENTEEPDTPTWKAFQMQYDQFLHAPDPIMNNDKAYLVKDEMSGKGADKLLNDVASGYLKGEIDDLDEVLQEITDQDNKAFEEALEKVKEDGVDIKQSDWVFEDWEPGKSYDE